MIGPNSKKPLIVSTPFSVRHGLQKALSDRAKYALALGQQTGWYLLEYRGRAVFTQGKEQRSAWIIQYPAYPCTAPWTCWLADALEIQLGQGASSSAAQAPTPT